MTNSVHPLPGLLDAGTAQFHPGVVASKLAAAGVPVFPCAAGGKAPLTRRGFHAATTGLGQVHRWWDRSPNANIGVPTGAASGLDVVDVDLRADGSGFSWFEHARVAGLVTGWSWLVRTPSGGLHAYFPHDPAKEQRSWSLPGPHIDFRGDGGYVVVPPSAIAQPGGGVRQYRLIAVSQHQPRPVAAAQLRAFLSPRPPGPRPADLGAPGAPPDRLAAWVATRPEGARNQSLF